MAVRKEKYRYSRVLLHIAAILYLFSFFLADRFDQDTQWLIFDITNLLLICIAFAANLMTTPYRATYIKVLSLALLVVAVWHLADYILITYYEDSIHVKTIRNITGAIFALTLAPMLVIVLLRSYSPGNSYNDTSSFIAFKKPLTVQGLFGALIFAPYGQASLVIEGREFLYKKGKLVERKHRTSSAYTYKTVRPVRLEYMRQYKGRRWRLRDNCFIFFRRIAREGYKRGRVRQTDKGCANDSKK